jgi:hypothetical protein
MLCYLLHLPIAMGVWLPHHLYTPLTRCTPTGEKKLEHLTDMTFL